MTYSCLQSLLLLSIASCFFFKTIFSLPTSQSTTTANDSTSSEACQCRKRSPSSLEKAFMLANQPGCIHLYTMEAGKVPCTQRMDPSNTTMPPRSKSNSTSVTFHIASWDTSCLANHKQSSECFRSGKRECTWTEEIKKVTNGPAEHEMFPAFELQVNCEGCHNSSCLKTSGSCSYQQNLVRYLPLIKTGKCANDGYEEWVAAKSFRIVNAACSCIYHG